MSLDRLIEFKRKTAAALAAAARVLEESWPPLNGHGGEAVLGVYELAIGVGHLTSSSGVVRQALDVPGLEVFRLEFEGQLAQSLRWLLAGLASKTRVR